MSTRLARPELALRDLLNAKLAQSTECIFAVAYIDRLGVAAVRDVLEERLRKKSFRLRVLFRATDVRAEPAALEDLLRLAAGARGVLEVRYSRHPKFHAKAFGFRRSRAARPSVILGSANLLDAALSVDSGELGVLLHRSAAADEAWGILEDFWGDGRPVTPAWLASYRERHEDIRQKSKAADRAIRRWAKGIKRQRRSFHLPDLVAERFYVVQTEWLDADTQAKAERAVKEAEASEIEVPDGYYTWRERPDLPADANILEVFWSGKDARLVRLVRLQKVVRVVDPKSEKRLWLVGFMAVRRGRLNLRLRDAVRNERRLARHGLSWRDLDASGYVRGRRKRLVAALHVLGWPRAPRVR